jgi:hypothetical protein
MHSVKMRTLIILQILYLKFRPPEKILVLDYALVYRVIDCFWNYFLIYCFMIRVLHCFILIFKIKLI